MVIKTAYTEKSTYICACVYYVFTEYAFNAISVSDSDKISEQVKFINYVPTFHIVRSDTASDTTYTFYFPGYRIGDTDISYRIVWKCSIRFFLIDVRRRAL